MSTSPRILALGLAALSLVGCDDTDDTTTATPPPAVTTTPPAQETAETKQVDEATRVKFNTLVEQVTAHIRNREFDAAETGLRSMADMRDQLDEPMRKQIETVRAALGAARAAPAAQTPG